MTSSASESSVYLLRDAQDFSLVHGGPLFQLLLRAHLSSDAMTLVARRLVTSVLLTWVPLLVLSALGGQLFHMRIAVPFLLDLETHIRFLVVEPLLLGAELIVHQRLLWVTRTFLDRHLIPVAALPRFDAAITSAFRLRNSVPAACSYTPWALRSSGATSSPSTSRHGTRCHPPKAPGFYPPECGTPM